MSDPKTKHPEQMDEFFNLRASSYDEHMRNSLDKFDQFYQALCRPIAPTGDPVPILVIGIGTGNELSFIFDKTPNGQVTGIDLSGEMLEQLRSKYQERIAQIDLIEGSYLETDFGKDHYRYAVSVMTLHHLLPDKKLGLYKRVHDALVDGGVYLEGDYYVSAEKSRQMLATYQEKLAQGVSQAPGQYHIDIPLTIPDQEDLLREAGFSEVELVWSELEAGVLAARK